MGTGVRVACITHGGPRSRGSARDPDVEVAPNPACGGGKIHDKARCQILFCALCLNPKVAASQGREEEAQAERGDGMLHDYAGCLFPLCALCQGYAEGYAAGKQKAHDEVRLWKLGAHEPDCGCDPCLSALAVVQEFLSANSKPVTLPDRHLEDCAGPGCGASCACWCHAAERPS